MTKNSKQRQVREDGKILIFRPYFHKPDGTIVRSRTGKMMPMWVEPSSLKRK